MGISLSVGTLKKCPFSLTWIKISGSLSFFRFGSFMVFVVLNMGKDENKILSLCTLFLVPLHFNIIENESIHVLCLSWCYLMHYANNRLVIHSGWLLCTSRAIQTCFPWENSPLCICHRSVMIRHFMFIF